jgi:hypothetical protein
MLHTTTFTVPCTKTCQFIDLSKNNKELPPLYQAFEERERLCKSLKHNREPEFLNNSFERYLSLLPDLGKIIEKYHQDNSLTTLRYQWQSTLTAGSKFFSDSVFAFEVAMALTAYGTSIIASEILFVVDIIRVTYSYLETVLGRTTFRFRRRARN